MLELIDVREIATGKTPIFKIEKPERRPHRRKGVIAGHHAYCDSRRCSSKYEVDDRGRRRFVQSTIPIIKDVPPGTFQCPDCSMTLIWIDA